MEPHDDEVIKIDGEYATLKDIESGAELFIALALLPQGTDTGSQLNYEMFGYSLK